MCLGPGPRSPVLVSPNCPEFTEGVRITHALAAHFRIISEVEHGKGWESLITGAGPWVNKASAQS